MRKKIKLNYPLRLGHIKSYISARLYCIHVISEIIAIDYCDLLIISDQTYSLVIKWRRVFVHKCARPGSVLLRTHVINMLTYTCAPNRDRSRFYAHTNTNAILASAVRFTVSVRSWMNEWMNSTYAVCCMCARSEMRDFPQLRWARERLPHPTLKMNKYM